MSLLYRGGVSVMAVCTVLMSRFTTLSEAEIAGGLAVGTLVLIGYVVDEIHREVKTHD